MIYRNLFNQWYSGFKRMGLDYDCLQALLE